MAVDSEIAKLTDLTGKVAIVTGAAREQGLGRHIVQRLAGAGASVMIMDVRADEGEATAERLAERGLPVDFVAGDVRESKNCKAAVAATVAAFGSLDILVNNAALCSVFWTGTMPEEEWDRVIDINLKGTHLMCQAALEVMLPRGGDPARIVNIASVGAFQPVCPDNILSAYNASKAGVVMYTKSLAKELLYKNVHVNCVAPGNMPTEIPCVMGIDEDQQAKMGAVASKQPPAPTGEVASMVLALASNLGNGVRGQTVVVDGGNLLLVGGDEFVAERCESVV